MPDVTPKTESGRALLDGIENPMRPVPLNYASTADAILAIEQEAASKAVAEVGEAIVDLVYKHVHGHEWDFDSAGFLDDLALIASERKP